MDGVSRLLAPFRIDDDLPVRPTATFAIVDGERVDGRNRGLLVYRDCSAVGSGEDPSAVVAALLTALNRAAVDRCEFFAAHAGVVAIGGTAVAFPAESGRGKSTLTAACLKAGFEYVSDEAICVDPETDDLIAYPKPIGLSPWSRAALDVDDNAVAFPSDAHEAFVTAGDLGAGVAQGPLESAGDSGFPGDASPAGDVVQSLQVRRRSVSLGFAPGQRLPSLATELSRTGGGGTHAERPSGLISRSSG